MESGKTEKGSDASKRRAEQAQAVSSAAPKTGGILAALLRSPMVGADLDLTRAVELDREVDL